MKRKKTTNLILYNLIFSNFIVTNTNMSDQDIYCQPLVKEYIDKNIQVDDFLIDKKFNFKNYYLHRKKYPLKLPIFLVCYNIILTLIYFFGSLGAYKLENNKYYFLMIMFFLFTAYLFCTFFLPFRLFKKFFIKKSNGLSNYLIYNNHIKFDDETYLNSLILKIFLGFLDFFYFFGLIDIIISMKYPLYVYERFYKIIKLIVLVEIFDKKYHNYSYIVIVSIINFPIIYNIFVKTQPIKILNIHWIKDKNKEIKYCQIDDNFSQLLQNILPKESHKDVEDFWLYFNKEFEIREEKFYKILNFKNKKDEKTELQTKKLQDELFGQKQ